MARPHTARFATWLSALILLAASAGCRSGSSPDGRPSQKLNPTRVSSSEKSDLGLLFDRDTTRGRPLARALEFDVTFAHDVDLHFVKVLAKTSATFEVEGESLSFPGGEAWQRSALEAPRRGSRFRIKLSPVDGEASIQELELWGAGGPTAPADGRALAEASRGGQLSAFENVTVIRAEPAIVDLHPVGLNQGPDCVALQLQVSPEQQRATRRAYLAYEGNALQRPVVLRRSVNGHAPVGGHWLGDGARVHTVADELNVAQLDGTDRVSLCLPQAATATVHLTDPRLILVLDDGLHPFSRDTEEALSEALDGDLRTLKVLSGAPLSLALDRTLQIDAAELYLDTPTAKITARLDDAEPLAAELAQGWNPLGWAGLSGGRLEVTFDGSIRPDLPAAKVAELRVVGSPVGAGHRRNQLVVTYPRLRQEAGRWVGERFGDKAFVVGWADAASGEATVELDGVPISSLAGGFSQALTAPADATDWSATLTARFPDGTQVSRVIHFAEDNEDELLGDFATAAGSSQSADARYGAEEETAWGRFDKERGGKVTLGTDVSLTAPAGAVDRLTSIGITRKNPRSVPPLDPGMVNVSAPSHGAYRFSPAGQQFSQPVEVVIPYDPSLLPSGVADEEVLTYFYDRKERRWSPLRRRELRRASHQVVSETSHFTFMVNAVLVTPEHPGPASFNPNSIKDLKAADPSAGIDFMGAPSANNLGTARTTFPIRLPPARGAFQPQLALSYDSGGGDGWLGVGWDLPLSSIQLDTRFGAPRYDGEDLYSFDGEQLVPSDANATCSDGKRGRRYHPRVERDFRRILRCGEDVRSFWFEVTDKGGTLYVYGVSGNSRLQGPPLVSGGLPGPIGRWDLDRVVDANDNLTYFEYEEDKKTAANTEPAVGHNVDFRQHTLRAVYYTGRIVRAQVLQKIDLTSSSHGFGFKVELVPEQDAGKYLPRPDPILSGRLGFKVLTRHRLGTLNVRQLVGDQQGVIRGYALTYSPGDFGKSLLTKVDVYGRGGTEGGEFFYAHELEYSKGLDPAQSELQALAAPRPLPFLEANGTTARSDIEALSASKEWVAGYQASAGLKLASELLGLEGVAAGFNFGYSHRESESQAMLVDLNGDGLPDRVSRSGVLFNHGPGRGFRPSAPAGDPAELLGPPKLTFGLFENQLPSLGREGGENISLGYEASVAGALSASITGAASWGHASESLADADGDGLIDFVTPGGVLFQQPRVPGCSGAGCCPAGEFCFAAEKQLSALEGAAADLEDDPTMRDHRQQLEDSAHPMAALLEWTAPYDGTVDISGDLRFVHPTDPAPGQDGVRLIVFQKDNEEVAFFKSAGDATATRVNLTGRQVTRGQRIHFVLGTEADMPTNAASSPLEEVSFSPTIKYTRCSGDCGSLSAEDPLHKDGAGSPLFRFNAQEDFRLAGDALQALFIPRRGKISITGTVTKRPTSDDVRLCVLRFSSTEEVDPLARCPRPGKELVDSTPLLANLRHDLSADLSVNREVEVLTGDSVVLRVDTDLTVDPDAADWVPTVRMTELCNDDGTGCRAPTPEEQTALTFEVQPFFPVHGQANGHPIRPFIVPGPGSLRIHSNNELAIGLEPIHFSVRTHNRLLIKHGPSEEREVTLNVQGGEQLIFESHSEQATGQGWDITVELTQTDSKGTTVTRLHPQLHYTSDRISNVELLFPGRSPFGGGFRQWRYGHWNGLPGEPFELDLLEPRDIESFADFPGSDKPAEEKLFWLSNQLRDPKGYLARRLNRLGPLVPRRVGTRVGTEAGLKPERAFVSVNGLVFVGRGTMHGARQGARGGTGTHTVSTSLALGRMFATRHSLNMSLGAGFSASLDPTGTLPSVSMNVGAGWSSQKLDLADLNGDGVLDVAIGPLLGPGRSELTDIHTLAPRSSPGLGAIQEGFDLNAGFGMGHTMGTVTKTAGNRTESITNPRAGESLNASLGLNLSVVTQQLVDVNGDGLPDQLRWDYPALDAAPRLMVRLNLGGAFAASEDELPVKSWLSKGRFESVVGELLDEDWMTEAPPEGEDAKKTDTRRSLRQAVLNLSDPESISRSMTHTVQGSLGFSTPLIPFVDVNLASNADTSISETQVALLDVTGDGLPDFVRRSGWDPKLQVRVNTGYGFAQAVEWELPPWTTPQPRLQLPGTHANIPFADKLAPVLSRIRGPFSVDSVQVSGTHTKLAGVSFGVKIAVPLIPEFISLTLGVGYSGTPERLSGFELGFMDIDGDGFADHVLKPENWVTETTDDRAVYYRRNQYRGGNLLRRVRRPLGGSFELAYASQGNTVDLPGRRDVLDRVVVHSGLHTSPQGESLVTTYAYADGKQDRHEREFLGFRTVTQLRPDGSRQIQVFKNDAVEHRGLLEREEFRDADNKLYSASVNLPGTPRPVSPPTAGCRAKTPFFLLEDRFCASVFIPLVQTEGRLYEGSTEDVRQPLLTTRQRYTFDLFGNVETFEDLGDVADPTDDLHAQVDYDWETNHVAKEAHRVANPALIVVASGQGDELRRREGFYDARGNLVRLRSKVDSGTWAESTLEWEDTGKLRRATGPGSRGYWVEYEYESATRNFPQRTQDAFGYFSQATFDLGLGAALSTTDVSGNQTHLRYDGFGRLKKVYSPYDTVDSDFPTSSIHYVTTSVPARAVTYNKLPDDISQNDGWLETVVFVDGLGRFRQTMTDSLLLGADKGKTVSGQVTFDALGRTVAQGQPFFAPEAEATGYLDAQPINPTKLAYDVLGRTRELLEANGALTQLAYSIDTPDLARLPGAALVPRRKTRTTDAKGKVRAEYRDVGDRVVAIEEHAAGNIHTTGYRYNPLGELLTIADAKGNLTLSEYDLLGRRTGLENPDVGVTAYTYDLASNLIKKVDANLRAAGAATTYEYRFNRLQKIVKPTSTVAFAYGEPGATDANSLGRIVLVTDDAGTEARSYGRLGEVTSTTRTVRPLIPGEVEESFTTTFKFDVYGRLLDIGYPDNEHVLYGYDEGGMLNKAIGVRYDAAGTETGRETYLSELIYNEFGQRRRAVLGNGVVTSYDYEPLTQRLHTLNTLTPSARTLQGLTYGYDPVGNISTLTNALGQATGPSGGSVTFEYTYDDLHRLENATGVSTVRGMRDSFSSHFKYDAIHNMTVNQQVRGIVKLGVLENVPDHPEASNHDWTYEYTGAGPHRATRIGDTLLSYDGNGNTLSECHTSDGTSCSGGNRGGQRLYSWTEENWLKTVVAGAGQRTTRFVYDAAGQRVAKIGETGLSLSIGQFYSVKSRQFATKHIFAGTTRVASKVVPFQSSTVRNGGGTTTVAGGNLPPGLDGNLSGCEQSGGEPMKCRYTSGHWPIGGQGGASFRNATYYYHSDHLGSTSWLTNQLGEVVEHIEYYPYGEVWNEQREGSRQQTRDIPRFLFTSKELDEETGLTYFGARYYDSKKARWASTDPLYLEQGTLGLNPYHYALWSPVLHIDPDGRAVPRPPAISLEERKESWSQSQTQLEHGCASGSNWSCFAGWIHQALEPSPPTQLDAALMAFEITPSPLTVVSPVVKAAGKVVTSAVGKAASKTSARGFKPPSIRTNGRGQLTNGPYTLDAPGMVPHKTGATSGGKSQFLSYVDAEKATLDAAAYADEAGLWVGNKAKVFVENGPVGVLGNTGELTNWINVYRTKTGFVHGAPGSAP